MDCISVLKDSYTDNEAEADIIFTTIHQSKGLEWERVQLGDDIGANILSQEFVTIRCEDDFFMVMPFHLDVADLLVLFSSGQVQPKASIAAVRLEYVNEFFGQHKPLAIVPYTFRTVEWARSNFATQNGKMKTGNNRQNGSYVDVIRQIEFCSLYRRHGFEKVRGWIYLKDNLSESDKIAIETATRNFSRPTVFEQEQMETFIAKDRQEMHKLPPIYSAYSSQQTANMSYVAASRAKKQLRLNTHFALLLEAVDCDAMGLQEMLNNPLGNNLSADEQEEVHTPSDTQPLPSASSVISRKRCFVTDIEAKEDLDRDNVGSLSETSMKLFV